MSVVVYRDGVLSADTKVSDHHTGEWLGTMTKIKDIDGMLVGAIGAATDVDRILGWFIEWDIDSSIPFPKLTESANAIQVDRNGRIYLWSDGHRTDVSRSPFIAIGAGRDVALGALEWGAPAVNAVRAACVHVPSCGEPIDVLKFDLAKDQA